MFRSWRLASVALASFSSGLPLGLVWIAIPTWMAQAGVDIKVVGLFTLAQAPWSFKFLWAPLMDRFPPPFLGKRRGWILVSQLVLLALGLGLALVADRSEAVGVIGAITLLTGPGRRHPGHCHRRLRGGRAAARGAGRAVGARTALYRAAMFVSGGVASPSPRTFDVTLFGRRLPLVRFVGLVNLLLALCFIPCLWITWSSPEPEEGRTLPPRRCGKRSGAPSWAFSASIAPSRSSPSWSSTS